MSLISLPQAFEFAKNTERGGGVTSTKSAPNRNPCAYQEDQPLTLHKRRGQTAQALGAI